MASDGASLAAYRGRTTLRENVTDLAVPTLLRPLSPEHGAGVVQPLRQVGREVAAEHLLRRRQGAAGGRSAGAVGILGGRHSCREHEIRTALSTPAVPSGRRVTVLPLPPSGKVYISLLTTSVSAPIARQNSSVCSITGVETSSNP